jgi:hypothetical protein
MGGQLGLLLLQSVSSERVAPEPQVRTEGPGALGDDGPRVRLAPLRLARTIGALATPGARSSPVYSTRSVMSWPLPTVVSISESSGTDEARASRSCTGSARLKSSRHEK